MVVLRGDVIIKLGESLAWPLFKKVGCSRSHSGCQIRALRIPESFLYETPSNGYLQGTKNQWCVELGDNYRCAMDHEPFTKLFELETTGAGTS